MTARAVPGVPVFQSSPAPKDGRYYLPRFFSRSILMFQSSPAPKDGRYLDQRAAPDQGADVSILARPEGRALPSGGIMDGGGNSFQSSPAPKDGRYLNSRPGVPGPIRFNPRPPRRTGATLTPPIDTQGNVLVSILARPEGRALPPRPACRSPARSVSILARPEGRALHEFEDGYDFTIKFQSSPAPKDGRYSAAVTFRCGRFISGLGANLGAPRRQGWVW